MSNNLPNESIKKNCAYDKERICDRSCVARVIRASNYDSNTSEFHCLRGNFKLGKFVNDKQRKPNNREES